MSPRAWLLLAATLCGWVALLLCALSSTASPLVAVAAAAVALAVWHRTGRWASIAAPAGCVALLVAGTSLQIAAVSGVLVLVHLVLVDLADDAHGSAVLPVLVALEPLAAGVALAAGAVVVVVMAAWAGAVAPVALVGAALLGAPLLLLSAVLVALGMDTRRDCWRLLVNPKELSAVTKRYLARAGLRP